MEDLAAAGPQLRDRARYQFGSQSPDSGLLVGLFKNPTPEESEQAAMAGGGMRKCPFCAEFVKKEAVLCRYCGKELPKSEPSSASAKPKRPPSDPAEVQARLEEEKESKKTLITRGAIVGVGFVVWWMVNGFGS